MHSEPCYLCKKKKMFWLFVEVCALKTSFIVWHLSSCKCWQCLSFRQLKAEAMRQLNYKKVSLCRHYIGLIKAYGSRYLFNWTYPHCCDGQTFVHLSVATKRSSTFGKQRLSVHTVIKHELLVLLDSLLSNRNLESYWKFWQLTAEHTTAALDVTYTIVQHSNL